MKNDRLPKNTNSPFTSGLVHLRERLWWAEICRAFLMCRVYEVQVMRDSHGMNASSDVS